MYKIECQKDFYKQLEVPIFSERYEKLFGSRKKRVAYFKNEFDNSTFRYRCINVVQSTDRGDDYTVSYFLCSEIPRILPVIDQLDIIVLQRTFWTPDVENLAKVAHRLSIPVAYDMDDLFFTIEHAVEYINHIGQEYAEKMLQSLFGAAVGYRKAAECCDAFIATVPMLARELERYFGKPAFVLHNFLNDEQIEESEYVIKNREECDNRFHLGYFSGSPTHLIDLRMIEKELIALMEKYDDIDLVIVGMMDLPEKLAEFKRAGRVIFREFVPFQELQYEIGRVDVNIAPLLDDDFNEAKSELKFFEAGMVKVPSCVADTEIYRTVVKDGENGFLCGFGEWFSKLERLYLDRELRRNMAEKAYRTAIDSYAPENQLRLIGETYDRLLELKKIKNV